MVLSHPCCWQDYAKDCHRSQSLIFTQHLLFFLLQGLFRSAAVHLQQPHLHHRVVGGVVLRPVRHPHHLVHGHFQGNVKTSTYLMFGRRVSSLNNISTDINAWMSCFENCQTTEVEPRFFKECWTLMPLAVNKSNNLGTTNHEDNWLNSKNLNLWCLQPDYLLTWWQHQGTFGANLICFLFLK